MVDATVSWRAKPRQKLDVEHNSRTASISTLTDQETKEFGTKADGSGRATHHGAKTIRRLLDEPNHGIGIVHPRSRDHWQHRWSRHDQGRHLMTAPRVGVMDRLRVKPSTAAVGGQALGQLLQVVALPLVARTYGPVGMGYYQVAIALSQLIQPLATLRLEYLIPAFSGPIRRRLFYPVIVISICLGLVSISLTTIFLTTRRSDWAVVTSSVMILVMAQSLMLVDSAFLVRRRLLRLIGTRGLIAGFVTALTQVAAVVAGLPLIALALSVLLGRVVAVVLTRPGPGGVNHAATSQGTPSARLPGTAYAVATGMLQNGSAQSLAITFGWVVGPAAAGQVGIAQRIANAPTVLVARSVSQVLQSRVAELVRNNEPGLQAILRGIAKRALLIVLALSGGLAVGGYLFVEPIFGSEWEEASILIPILALPLVAQVAVNPLSTLLFTIGRSATAFRLQLLRGLALLLTPVVTSILTTNLYAIAGATSAMWLAAHGVILSAVVKASATWDARTCDDRG